MKKSLSFIGITILILTLLIPSYIVSAAPPAPSNGNGVDIFRGAWGGTLKTDAGDYQLNLYFNESIADSQPGWFKASGYSSLFLLEPKQKRAKTILLPMMAKYHQTSVNTFDIIIFATFQQPPPSLGTGSTIFKLVGTAKMNGPGVPEDTITGLWYFKKPNTQDLNGQWTVNHLDRRVINAPPIPLNDPNLDLFFQVDASADLRGPCNVDILSRDPYTYTGTYSNIVMDRVRVDFPNGSTITLPQFADLFTPEVDWINYFRYASWTIGLPLAGGKYRFTALDVIGNPIPGVQATDVWVGVPPPCPPSNTKTEWINSPIPGIKASWDAISNIPGSFVPPSVGAYNIFLYGPSGPWLYAGSTTDITHLIPKSKINFIQNADRGASLEELQAGTYQLLFQSISMAPSGSAGKLLEYVAQDWAQCWFFDVSGGVATNFRKVH